MKRTMLTPLAFCLSTAIAAAQEGGAKTEAAEKKPASTTPALKLETSDLMVGTGFLARFDPEAELPDAPADTHYVITVFTDGKVKHATAKGDVGWMRSTIYPTALMKLFEDEIEENWERVSEGAIVGLTQMGMTTKDAAILMKSVKEFPHQVEQAQLAFSGHPQNELNGLKIQLSVTPKEKTWLGNLATHLRPHAKGAPRLQADDPMMWLGIAVDPEGFNAFLSPTLAWFAKITGKNKKEREKHANLYQKMVNTQDGTYWMVGNPFAGGLRSIGGLRGARTLADLMASADYSQMIKFIERMSPTVETEYDPTAFVHRDVQVTKTMMSSDIETPFTPNGDQITYSAVVGDYLVSGSRLSVENTKKLIDRVLDQKVPREALPGKALMVGEFKLMELLDATIPFGNPLEGEADPPKKMRMVFENRDGSFHATLHFK